MLSPFFLTEECALKTCLYKTELIYFQHNWNYSLHSPVVWMMHHYWIDTRHQINTQRMQEISVSCTFQLKALLSFIIIEWRKHVIQLDEANGNFFLVVTATFL